MRRSLGKLSHPAIVPTSRKALFLSSPFDFSTSAEDGGDNGGAGGRGRGRGSDFSKYSFVDSTPGKSEPKSPGEETSSPPPLGHGRGKPSNIPQFTSFGAPSGNRGTIMGRGCGIVPPSPSEENLESRTRISFRKEGEAILPPKVPGQSENQEKSTLPPTILSVLSGAGRGQPTQATAHSANEKVVDVNRHVKPRQPVGREPPPASPKMSKEEAINKARSILSRGGDGGVEDGGGGGQGSIGMGTRDGGGSQGSRGMGTRDGSGSQGFRGMGTRDSGGRGQWGGRGGRGSGRGRGRGQGRGRGMSYRDDDDKEEDEEDTEVDKANAEKLEKHLGLKKMDILVQAFEEACAKVFPSLEEDAHVDAMHTNLLLECEPEYLMAEFDSNPDIDENPPIALRDALEKMKPFLMSYENIQTEKEWQDVVEETMKNVPLMKELVDFYGGPNKVTAKKQGLELERVAKTLPASAPTSVKRFTDRAVLSLQSNPGWGFDKKCQFMDKLVWEVSQSYK